MTTISHSPSDYLFASPHHPSTSTVVKELMIFRHLVTSFVRKDINGETRRSNFVVILDWLRSLSEKQELPLHETCILTLCHIAEYASNIE
jgi:serine/threonine-protein kinase ATR